MDFDEDQVDEPRSDSEPTNDDNGSVFEFADSDHSSVSSASDGQDDEDEEEEDVTSRLFRNARDFEWDDRSSSSGEDTEQEIDEWFPLPERRTEYPNVYMPDTTPHVFSVSYTPPERRPRNIADSDEDEGNSLKNDEGYQAQLKECCPNPSREELNEFVLDYMVCHGFSEAAEALCREMKMEVPTEEIRLMHMRTGLKEAITEGNMTLALEKIEELCPGLLQENKDLHFKFRRQHIIEMIRAGGIDEPIRYAREHLKEEMENPEILEELEKTFTLIVYDVEDESPFHYLYSQNERAQLANQVNSTVLGKLGKPKFSRLDMLSKTIAYARNETLEMPSSNSPAEINRWAKRQFENPHNTWTEKEKEEYISLALQKDPLDYTEELC